MARPSATAAAPVPDARASALLLSLLLLAACDRGPPPPPADGVGGPDPSIAGEIDAASALPNGIFGVTAADCDPDNRYMNETVIILADGLLAEDRTRPLREIEEDGTLVFGADGQDSERIRIDGDRLIRWPDQPRLRTVYARCDDGPERSE